VKKRVTVSLLGLAIGFLLLTGCQANNEEPAPNPDPQPLATWTPVASLEDIMYDANVPGNIIIEGRRTFQSSCSACHDSPTTQRIKEFSSDEALIELAIPMTEASGLPLDYSEKVIRYMLAVRNNKVP
jgi:hypothetical protein